MRQPDQRRRRTGVVFCTAAHPQSTCIAWRAKTVLLETAEHATVHVDLPQAIASVLGMKGASGLLDLDLRDNPFTPTGLGVLVGALEMDSSTFGGSESSLSHGNMHASMQAGNTSVHRRSMHFIRFVNLKLISRIS